MIGQAQLVYHSTEIQAWEKRWFAANNSTYGLMQQAAWAIALKLMQLTCADIRVNPQILVWCGQGNNAGDGFLVAKYLKQFGYQVRIFQPWPVLSDDAMRARTEALDVQLLIQSDGENLSADIHIDALFGIGLNRALGQDAQKMIGVFNAKQGFKVSIDLPSGLNPNTGVAMPVAVEADLTYCLIGLKAGLLTGQAGEYSAQIELLPLIPTDQKTVVLAAYQAQIPQLPIRKAHQHKGSFGHVLVIGGHPNMGGAVMMSAEAAMASGAGKATVLCDVKHHGALMSRSPNIMVKDIANMSVDGWAELLAQIDTLCFGMGLGRDVWGEQHFISVINALKQQDFDKTVVWDADALWFLTKHAEKIKLQPHWILTPHVGEAARLLSCTVSEVEADRIAAIYQLQQRYGGQWVLKGAGSLSLQNKALVICGLGNPGMGTAGMGDVLSGMMASLKGQFSDQISVADIVALHAAAGDVLAKKGMRGVQAQHMPQAIYEVVNASI